MKLEEFIDLEGGGGLLTRCVREFPSPNCMEMIRLDG